jgi:hypothetical protein
MASGAAGRLRAFIVARSRMRGLDPDNIANVGLADGEAPLNASDIADTIEALDGMVRQFAYWSDTRGGYTTGGLSALEDAFDDWGGTTRTRPRTRAATIRAVCGRRPAGRRR